MNKYTNVYTGTVYVRTNWWV